jgi:hypothetical protein
MNARCSKQGSPIIYAFSTAPAADLFGRIFDGLGRLHIIHNSSFNKGTKGMAVATSSGDFDATGTLLFETSKGQTVTVNYAFDNSTTLSKQQSARSTDRWSLPDHASATGSLRSGEPVRSGRYRSTPCRVQARLRQE